MSCSVSCPCQFSWPVDTLGHKRDPVNSEKAWLDFAVRSLSREAVGKGRGQETVWNSACRPAWWDAEVGLPWKNPTANPKDTKEALLQKYEGLEHHLKLEGRFPKELEEEARLWSEGKYKELFLMTSFTTLLGKVTGLHSAVLDSSAKAEEMKAEINQDLIQDIKTCLSSTLSAIENIKTSGNKSAKKRSHAHLDRENIQHGKENHPMKKLKKILPSLSESKCPVHTASENKSVSVDTNKLVQKCALSSKVPSASPIQTTSRKSRKQSCVPSLTSKASSNQKEKSVAKATSVQPSVDQKSPQPMVFQVSQEEFDKILQGSSFTLPLSAATESPVDYLLDNVPSENAVTESLPPAHLPQPSVSNTSICQTTVHFDSLSTCGNPVVDSDSKCNISEIIPSQTESVVNNFVSHGSPSTSTASHCLLSDSNSISPSLFPNFQPNSVPLSIPVSNIPACDILSSFSSAHSDSDSQEITLGRGSPSSIPNSEIDMLDMGIKLETPFPLSSNSRVSSGRVASSGSSSHHSSAVTDAGYSSDEGQGLDILDSMFNKEEQDRLWQEDGSVLLDKFLESF